MTARHFIALVLGLVVSIAVAVASVFAFLVGVGLAGVAIIALRFYKPRVQERDPDGMIDITSQVREV